MSLVRTLMSDAVTESVDLTGYDYSEQASMESYFTDAACESLVRDIFKVEQAFYTADIIGEVKVIQEGADPAVLLEGIVGDAFGKLKESFKKFLAKIKEWAAKVKKFFKVLFMKGKELAKTYGSEIRKKSVKGFKYKGFEYDIKAGDALVEDLSGKCNTEITKLLGTANITDARSYDANNDANKNRYGKSDGTEVSISGSAVANLTTAMSSSDYQDKFVKSLRSSCESVSELGDEIRDVYRKKETEKYEIEDFEANKPDEMLSFIETFDKNVKDIEREEKAFEKDINSVIKDLDKLSGESTPDASGNTTTTYKAASKVSSYVSAALTVKKSIVDKKVELMKEINGAFVSTLKSFLLKKEVKESAFFADFDSMIALTEGSNSDAPEADMSEDDVEATEEGCSGEKNSAEEGCSESLLEAAYNFM